MTPPLPRPLLETVINARQGDPKRADMRRDDFRIHVSDLIKTDALGKFCPRELVLSHFEQREKVFKGLPPGMELLYALGNAIHTWARTKYIKSQRGASAWGSWRCSCGRTKREGCSRPNIRNPANVCAYCRTPVWIYVEYSLYLHEYRLVGHPDFIIKWGSRYYLVEIKSIDRVDVDFDTLTAPLGDHTLQASFYYWMMKALGINVDDHIIYLYIDRSSRKAFSGYPVKEFWVQRSGGDRIKPFLDKCKAVINAVESKTLSPRICQTHKATRAKNCGACVSCFERRSDAIDYVTQEKIILPVKPHPFDAQEIWRTVEGWPLYQVSSWGRVRRFFDGSVRGGPRWRIRTPSLSSGYPNITLYRPNDKLCSSVHSLVCRAFHGERPTPQHQVAHWDNILHNNRATNLRWATKLENEQDKLRHGTRLRKLSNSQVKSILVDSRSSRVIASSYGVSSTLICNLKKGRSYRELTSDQDKTPIPENTISCFERRSSTIDYVYQTKPGDLDRVRRKPNLHSNGNVERGDGGVRLLPRPGGKKTRLDPQLFDTQGYPQPSLGQSRPPPYLPPVGRLRFRQPPSTGTSGSG